MLHWCTGFREHHLCYFEIDSNTRWCPSLVAITQGGAIQLANNGTDGVQGLQTLTMANAAAAQPGATILQYAQTSDGQQILVPSNQVVVQGEELIQQNEWMSFAVHFETGCCTS